MRSTKSGELIVTSTILLTLFEVLGLRKPKLSPVPVEPLRVAMDQVVHGTIFRSAITFKQSCAFLKNDLEIAETLFGFSLQGGYPLDRSYSLP